MKRSEEALHQDLIDVHIARVELFVERVVEFAVRVKFVGILRRDLCMGQGFAYVWLAPVSAAIDLVHLFAMWVISLNQDISCIAWIR